MSERLTQLALIEDDFKVSGSDWVHLFRYMVENGSIAKMSGSALKVYVVIKTLSGFENGKTTASQQTIADQSGLSVPGVKNAINELKNLGYLFSERFGRKNTYSIIEQIPTVHKSGTPNAIAEIPYQRANVQSLIRVIKSEFVKKLTGNEGIRDVNIIINTGVIENLNINGVETEPENIQVEFSLVEEFEKKIGKIKGKSSL
jgi:DNA-binding Lrp family transcriptional regulator